jgi:putative phosphoesterase
MVSTRGGWQWQRR